MCVRVCKQCKCYGDSTYEILGSGDFDEKDFGRGGQMCVSRIVHRHERYN